MAETLAHDVTSQAGPDRPGAAEAPDTPATGGPPDAGAIATAGALGHDVLTHEALPLVALVLGIAGVVLGVTVIWYFAAIPVGLVSVAVGLVARGRIHSYRDPRAASRATIGTALGCVAILLGLTGAYFLPRLMDRTNRFIGSVQENVNHNVGSVNSGLSRDVDKLDRTLSHDLHRFELQNRSDLTGLENRTALTMKALEDRLHSDVDLSSAAARRDLDLLESSLRADLQAAELQARNSDTVLHDAVAALDLRITRIERQLGIKP